MLKNMIKSKKSSRWYCQTLILGLFLVFVAMLFGYYIAAIFPSVAMLVGFIGCIFFCDELEPSQTDFLLSPRVYKIACVLAVVLIVSSSVVVVFSPSMFTETLGKMYVVGVTLGFIVLNYEPYKECKRTDSEENGEYVESAVYESGENGVSAETEVLDNG